MYIQLPNGSLTTVYCALYSACQDIPSWPNAPSGIYPFTLPNGSQTDVYCNNVTGEPEYTSCAHAHQVQPDLPPGSYTIQPAGSSPVTVHCDMDREECGTWMILCGMERAAPALARVAHSTILHGSLPLSLNSPLTISKLGSVMTSWVNMMTQPLSCSTYTLCEELLLFFSIDVNEDGDTTAIIIAQCAEIFET